MQPRYTEIRRQIDEPIPRVLDPDHPGAADSSDDLPPDDEWPAPTDYASCVALLRRFPADSVQRVLCALTAVEAVLPVWESRIDEQAHDDEHAGDVRRAIVALENWVRFRNPDDVRAAAQCASRAVATASRLTSDPALRETALNAADAMDQAAEAAHHAAHGDRDSSASAGAVWRAALACCGGAVADPAVVATFLRRWWSHCRRRLAWANAASTEIRPESVRRTAVPDERLRR
ncbi:MAG: hypothetical protein AB7K09_19720 [Planctomycetota bacterium]